MSLSLVIDASTNIFQVGIMGEKEFIDFNTTENCTLNGLFELLDNFVSKYKFTYVIYCEGPGHTLGIRSTLMFLRILAISNPTIQIFSYTNLELAYKMQNPIDYSDVLNNVDTTDTNNLNTYQYDEEELASLEFNKSLLSENPDREPISLNDNFFESLVCVAKNQTQFYVISNKKIIEIEKSKLEDDSRPVYILPTQTRPNTYKHAIKMEYLIELQAENIVTLCKKRSDIESLFDAHNEFVQWNRLRHK